MSPQPTDCASDRQPKDSTLGILRQFARIYKVEPRLAPAPVSLCLN